MENQSQVLEKIPLTREDIAILRENTERNLPKKVVDWFCYGLYGNCPSCNKLRTYGENYCSNCGQKIYFEVMPGVEQGK